MSIFGSIAASWVTLICAPDGSGIEGSEDRSLILSYRQSGNSMKDIVLIKADGSRFRSKWKSSEAVDGRPMIFAKEGGYSANAIFDQPLGAKKPIGLVFTPYFQGSHVVFTYEYTCEARISEISS